MNAKRSFTIRASQIPIIRSVLKTMEKQGEKQALIRCDGKLISYQAAYVYLDRCEKEANDFLGKITK